MKSLYFEISLALRYMLAQRKQKFVSITTILSFLGIAIGVATLITVLSVMNGFRSELFNRILGVNGHMEVFEVNAQKKSYQKLGKEIERAEGVLFAIPTIKRQGLVIGKHKSFGVLVKGADGKGLAKLPLIHDNIIEGDFQNFLDNKGILVGLGIANSLFVKAGDELSLLFPEGDSTPFGVLPQLVKFKVAGIFQAGIAQIDNSLVYLPLEKAHEIFDTNSTVSSIEVTTKNADKVGQYNENIKSQVSAAVHISDWRQSEVSLFNALQIERNVMFLILSLIIVIAVLNIVSGMTMLVKEKRTEIAILRTMGLQKSSVLRMFLISGCMIGALGTITGLGLGLFLCENIEIIRQLLSNLFQAELFPADVYFLNAMVAEVNVVETVFIVVVSFFLTVLATLIPSMEASRLHPAKQLRYN